MALNTPAKFGRQINYAHPFKWPVWTKSGDAEFPFPNVLGWQQVFVRISPVVIAAPPFIDAVSTLRTTLGGESPLITTLSARAPIVTLLDRLSKFRSSRITKSAK